MNAVNNVSGATIQLEQQNGATIKVPKQLLAEIVNSLSNIRGWGSVEIFIQDHKVTQITERNISKPDLSMYTTEEFTS